jgi:hypothetical protein
MRGYAVGLIGLALTGHGAAWATETGHGCHGTVSALTEEWNAIGFPAPSKPGQAYVIGKGNHRSSPAEVNAMRAQIQEAVRACESGQDEVALKLADTVRSRLDPWAKPATAVAESKEK